MPATPFAQIQYTVDGGGLLSGANIVTGANVIQPSGVNTGAWLNQLWEIYEYPVGFSVPASWSNVNGVYQSTAVTPPPFTLLSNSIWGKYLMRLTVNQGLLNGLYAGPGSPQPLVDISSALHVLSLKGTHDVCFGETNQFDAFRQWVGELKASLRALDVAGSVKQSLFADFSSTTSTSAQNTNLSIPVGANDVVLVEWGGNCSLASGTSGIKFALTGPTGATIEGGEYGELAAVTASTFFRMSALATLIGPFNTVAATLEGVEGNARIKMDGTHGGNIVLQCAPVAAVVATLKAGFWMRVSLVTEV